MDRLGPRLRRRRRACTRRRSTCRSRASATTADVAVPRLAGVRVDRRGDVGHLRVQAPGRTSRRSTIPVGALGDISSALFAVIGVLAALRHRDRTGEGQYVDIAMLDAMVAMTDIVTNFWSLGVGPSRAPSLQVICDGFQAADGYVRHAGRAASTSSSALADLVGQPEWLDDPRFATRAGLGRPPRRRDPAGDRGVGGRQDEARGLRSRSSAAGIAAGPVPHAAEVIADPHVAARNMLVEMPRTDGVGEPVLDPRQPGEDVEGGRGPRDPGARGSASTPTRCCAPSSASTTTSSPRCAPRA